MKLPPIHKRLQSFKKTGTNRIIHRGHYRGGKAQIILVSRRDDYYCYIMFFTLLLYVFS